MPVKDFDALNMSTTFSGYVSGPGGTATPVFTDFDFGRWNVSASDSQIPGVICSSNFSYEKTGDVDFTNPIVGIPANALISKVEVRYPRSTNIVVLAGSGGFASIFTIEARFHDGSITLPSNVAGNNTYTFSLSGSSADQIFDYSSSPITRAQLISNHGTQILFMGLSVSAGGIAGINNSVNYSLNFDLGFRIRVTYTDGPFSWYIKPTVKVINGGKIRTIQDPEDILAVPDGDVVPPGFEFYGTDDDFPSGPVFVWWISDDFFQFFVFSPISPSVILGGSDWTNFGASPPTCAVCLTIALGELTILIANASGIYTLTQGKTNDTLYLRADSSTFDFKIPNPFGKTGLVP